jgi:O-antigen/teichoic acid export membrane protein
VTKTDATTTFSAGRRHAAAWGAAFGYATTLVAVARNILLVPVYLRFIPLAEYGAWLATGASLAQIVITDYGLAGVLMQRASSLHGARRTAELGPLIGAGLTAAVALAVALSLLSIAVYPLLPDIRGFSSSESKQLANCFFLAVLANAIGVVAATAQGIVRSLQRSVVAGSATLLADIANIVATLAFLFAGAGIYAIAGGLVVRSSVTTSILVLYIVFVSRRLLKVSLRFGWRESRSIFVDSWHSFWLSISMRVQTQGNVFFVGTILGPESAAIYGLTVRAHDTVLILLSQINNAIAPSMAHLLGSGNTDRFKTLLFRIVPALALFSALGMVVTVIVNAEFVTLWVGHSVFGGQPVSILAALAVWVATIGFVGYDSLYALGKFRFISRTYVGSALVHVILMVILLRFGIWTAPLISIISSLVWGTLFWRRAIAEVQLTSADCRSIIKDIVRIGIIAVAVVAAFSTLPQMHSWISLAVEALASACLFLAAILWAARRLRNVIHEELRATLRSILHRS